MNDAEDRQNHVSQETIKYRIAIAGMALLCIWIIAALFKLQVLQHESYLFQAQSQQFGTVPVMPERGNIYDKDNNLLAYNSSDYTIIFNYRNLNDRIVNSCLKRISAVTGVPVSTYRKKMNNGKQEIVIGKKITGEKVLQLRELQMSYLNFHYEPTRIYTYGSFASHVLGYVNSKSLKGLNGVEYAFENHLAGVSGLQTVEKNRTGTTIEIIEEATVKPVRGNNVILTIEHGVQTVVEEVMAGSTNTNLRGSVIVMNPQNGEILGFYHSSPYDPNQFTLQENQSRKNGAVTDVYEPGSTFKSFTFASLIEHNAVTDLNEVIGTENGVYSPVRGITIRDNHKHASLSVQDVLAQSSNIGTIKLVSRLSNEQFYDDIRKLGFGNKTNIMLPSETNGLLKPPSSWSQLSKSSISYGYEIGVSAVQLIAAYAALINGGIYYEPKVVKAITDESGNDVVRFDAKPIRTVFSPATSAVMKRLLVRAVETGTGKKARIEGVAVGGKTGTSRRLHEGSYTRDKYNASFVGFFPAEMPKYLILVAVEVDSDASYTGGEVAAPIFKEIATKILARSKQPEIDETPKEETEFKVQFVSATEPITAEFVQLRGSNPINIKKSVMPDLRGLTLRDAVKYCTELGLQFKIQGNGYIAGQSIPAGQSISKGEICLLRGSLKLPGAE